MAKKKKDEESKENQDFFDSAVVKKMQKDYGAEFAVPLSSIDDKERGVVKTFPSLDIALSGGLSMGQTVQIAGKPKTGKTTLAFGIAANFQAENPDKKVFYYKVEGRLSSDLARGIPNLDLDRVVVVRSTIDHIMTGVEFLDSLEKNMRTFPESMHILDSVGGITGDGEMSNSMGDQQQGELAKLLAKFCRRNAGVIDITNSLFLALNHVRVKQSRGPAGGGTISPGGNHWMHQIDTDILLSIAFPNPKILSSDDVEIGHNLDVLVKTTTMGPPKQKAILPLVYGRGISRLMDVVNIAEQLSIIEKSGSWYNYGDKKWQGMNNLLTAVEEDVELYGSIEKAVSEMIA